MVAAVNSEHMSFTMNSWSSSYSRWRSSGNHSSPSPYTGMFSMRERAGSCCSLFFLQIHVPIRFRGAAVTPQPGCSVLPATGTAMGGFPQQILHLPSMGLCDSCCCYAVSTRVHVSILLAPCHNSNVLQLLGSLGEKYSCYVFFFFLWHSLHPFSLHPGETQLRCSLVTFQLFWQCYQGDSHCPSH